MKLERILRFCEKMIVAEKEHTAGLFADANSESSKAKIETYEKVMDFISNADKARESDYDKVKEIYQKHYSSHIEKMSKTKKSTFYNFTKKTERLIKDSLIPLIKQEIGNNPDSYGEMEVSTFFEFYMQNIPAFWRQNAFDISTLAKEDQFKKICLQIGNTNNAKIYGTGTNDHQKATMENLSSDLTLSKINMEMED